MANTIRTLGAAVIGAVLLAAAGCSGPSEAKGAAPKEGKKPAAESRASSTQAKGRTDLPPADYVRYRCSECSCAAFSGDAADCSRPGCRHHWSTHVRSFQ